jgi:uncharacterized membrane protein (DUF485 family)
MHNNDNTHERVQKSLKGRFLLVIGILFFMVYFVLGLIIIFWKEFPLEMAQEYRITFGVLLIGYSFLRFIRLMQNK